MCDRWLAGVVVSNPAGGMIVCVLSGRGLFVRLITRPGVVCLSMIMNPR